MEHEVPQTGGRVLPSVQEVARMVIRDAEMEMAEKLCREMARGQPVTVAQMAFLAKAGLLYPRAKL